MLGAALTQVRVTDIVGGQFHAELELAWNPPRTGSATVVSARASDAVALALHRRCPIYVAEAVFDFAGLPDARVATPDDDPDTPPAHGPDTPAIEDQVERLREALTEATPDDFRPDTPAPDENPPQDDSG